jgi:L-lactate utilization protein LutC
MQSLIKAIKSRNMNAYFVQTKQEAKEKALSLIDPKSEISSGGSETLKQIGLMDELRSGNYNFIDRQIAKDNKTVKHWIMKNSGAHGTYVSGTNALTEDGKLVNMDGWGNRVNAINYGPDKVIIVVGKNKIVKNLDEAIKRISDVASPPNTKRLGFKTPCAETGKCSDCRSPERICNILSVVQFQREPDRIHIIIVNEDL